MDIAGTSVTKAFRYEDAIGAICGLDWPALSQADLVEAAWAYYYFSIQFRESLAIARALHPADRNLEQLEREECDTSNLSPWPGVAASGERMNHDEFMRRLLQLSPIGGARRAELERIGQDYLQATRAVDTPARGMSIASYEAGGLEQVFNAFLTAPDWDLPLLQAFRHFLTEHIRFDSDVEQGHGALSRHLAPDDRILPLWDEFLGLLTRSVPRLAGQAATLAAE